MNPKSDPPSKRGWLKIELERDLASSSELSSARVYCPPRDKTISLEECAACSHCTGCVVDSGSREWLLRCERAKETPAAQQGEPEAAAADAEPASGDPPGATPQSARRS